MDWYLLVFFGGLGAIFAILHHFEPKVNEREALFTKNEPNNVKKEAKMR